ncbi:MAG: hypothetical protein V4649_19535 [Bacteroidota bacterium]
MNDNPYGMKGADPLDSPFGLRVAPAAPMPRPVPVPTVPVPLPSQYSPMGAMPRMAAQMQPILSALARAGRGAATVLPFRPVQHAAAVLTEAEGDNKPAAAKGPVSLADLINWQRKAESSGNYTALNKERKGNTASGAYQYTDGTWNGYGGFAKALYAPKEVQDRRFADDISGRYKKYGGDPFKTIAAHYLPAYAGNPSVWNQSIVVKGQRVRPVATYIRHVIKGTPLEAQFDEYLASIKSR